MENLPLELNTNILSRLPIKTLGQLKCVSKPFKTLITTHHFTKTHLNQITQLKQQLLVLSTSTLQTLNIFQNTHQSQIFFLTYPQISKLLLNLPSNLADNPIEVVGSCHGLVCLYHLPSTYSFLNPTTREFRVLPDPGMFPVDARIRLSGFGYVAVRDDYMVVSIGTDNTGLGEQVIRVYSAKQDSWKTVSTKVPFRVLPWVKPVCVNGVVHWLGFGGKLPAVNKIMGFDFVKEEFKVLSLGEGMNERGIKGLGVLGGCVCVLSTEKDVDAFLEMWIMMEYGVKESWIRTLSFGGAYSYNGITDIFPVCYVDDKVLLMIKRESIVSYDPVERISWSVGVNLRKRAGTLDVAMYEESLVSPYGFIIRCT